MKNTLTLLMLLFALNSYSQSINFEEDTTANLFDSREGSCSMADIDKDGDLDLLVTGMENGFKRCRHKSKF